MAKGRFESGASPSKSAKPASRTSRQPARRKKNSKTLPILLAVLGAVVVLGGAGLLLYHNGVFQPSNPMIEGLENGHIADRVFAAGVDLSNMTEQEAVEALEAVADQYNTDMKLTLTQKPTEGQTETNEPIELVFPATETNITLNPQKAFEEAYRVGREVSMPADGSEYVVPADRYLSMNTTGIQSLLDEACKAVNAGQVLEFKYRTVTEKRDVQAKQEDGTTKTEQKDVVILQVRKGSSAADFRKEDLFAAAMEGYASGSFDLQFSYEVLDPEPLDMDALYEELCTEPVEAYYDTEKHEIVDETVGYGFEREELQKLLDETEPGEIAELELKELVPEVTRKSLEGTLFSDVLASVSTPHTANWNRTHNLELACAAINGTVVQPGAIFSFNDTVGIRTEAKGYQPATAYVTGGASAEEIGGGVCQVASSIYYATLLADLKTIDRTEHMFAVTYVPMGMDAAIYWGSLDFKFQNDTDYPLRIDANVSGGYVNIALVGTDTKDYKVNMTYEVLSTTPWEEVEVETDEVAPGTVVTTAYTGYRVVTYMHKIDKTTGAEISVEKVAYSNYQKRDREIAIPVGGNEPTEATSDAPAEQVPDWTEPTADPWWPPSDEPLEPDPYDPNYGG